MAIFIATWTYATFILLDSDSILYQIFAILMTGFFGVVVLLGIRWVYRKAGLHFLD
ncbi:MAG: hypothetical protein WC346_11800 [Methanogenium sp.]